MKRLLAAIACVLACGQPARPAPPIPPPSIPQAAPVHEIDLATLRSTGKLHRFVRIVPFLEGGRMVGWKLYAPKDPELLGKLGLTAGDVIVRANGLALGSADKSLGVAVVLRETSRFDLDVLRKGQKVFVRIQLIGGTLGDALDLPKDDPLADESELTKVIDQQFDDTYLMQVAPNHFAYMSLARNRLYDAFQPFVRMRALLGRDLRNGIPLTVPWLARLGLQRGDILTEINGRALTSIDDLYEAIMDHRHSPTHIELRVRRAGQPVTLVFEQREII